MGFLDTWYTHFDVEDSLAHLEKAMKAKPSKTLHGAIAKARSKDSKKAANKLTYLDGNRLRFKTEPPELVQINDIRGYEDIDALRDACDNCSTPTAIRCMRTVAMCSNSTIIRTQRAKWSASVPLAPAAGSARS